MLGELRRIIEDSEVTKEDDSLWPMPDAVGRQVGPHLSHTHFLCTRAFEIECTVEVPRISPSPRALEPRLHLVLIRSF